MAYDKIFENVGWNVVRITTAQVYRIFVPVLTEGRLGEAKR